MSTRFRILVEELAQVFADEAEDAWEHADEGTPWQAPDAVDYAERILKLVEEEYGNGPANVVR